jgi:hypothetical protein
MNDRELLEAAAKAVGYRVKRPNYNSRGQICGLVVWFLDDSVGVWSPLDDDGDLLRLAVALDIKLTPGAADSRYAVAEYWVRPGLTKLEFERVLVESDRAAALRLAAVLAAAAIGAAAQEGAR